MARLTSTVNINLGGALEALSFFGIPNPVDWLSDADGDPEAIQQRTTAFIEAAQTMSDCADELKAGQQNLSWSGSAADVFGDILGAIWEGFKACVEFILWIPEIVLQIVDWILDLFRWVLNLVILVCTTICAIYVALCAVIAALSATGVGTAGIPAAITEAWTAAWAATKAGWVGTLGCYALIATVLAAAIRLLDWVVDKLVELLNDWREGLGDRLPTVPDWEPGVPPAFPV